MTRRTTPPEPQRSDPFRVHVERTGSPRVLRWVCQRADLVGDVPSPDASALTKLADDGLIRRAVGRDGDVIVDFGDASAIADGDRVRLVHDAVVSTLAIEPWIRAESRTSVDIRPRALAGATGHRAPDPGRRRVA